MFYKKDYYVNIIKYGMLACYQRKIEDKSHFPRCWWDKKQTDEIVSENLFTFKFFLSQ